MITCCVSAAFTTLQLICKMTRDGISADRVPLGYGNRSLDTRYFNRAMLQLPRGLIHVPCTRSYILFILCNKNFIKIIFVFPLVYENILTTKKVNLRYNAGHHSPFYHQRKALIQTMLPNILLHYELNLCITSLLGQTILAQVVITFSISAHGKKIFCPK